jgi:hypothetical protein
MIDFAAVTLERRGLIIRNVLQSLKGIGWFAFSYNIILLPIDVLSGFFEQEMVALLGPVGEFAFSLVIGFLSTALFCAWWSRRHPVGAWAQMAAGLAMTQLVAMVIAAMTGGLQVPAPVLTFGFCVMCAAAVSGTALGRRWARESGLVKAGASRMDERRSSA